MTPAHTDHERQERNVTMPAPTDHRLATWAFIAGAAGTVIAGAIIQTLVVPTTIISVDRWSYPWATGPYVAVSILYILLHVLVAAGLVAFGRSGVAGTTPAARNGIVIAIAGTLTLTAGEIAGLPIGDALTDDTSAQVVGSVFGLGVLLSAVGFLIVGNATLRARVWLDWHRYAALATGIWTSALLVLPLAIPHALPGGVAVYGTGLLAMAIGLHRELSSPHEPLPNRVA